MSMFPFHLIASFWIAAFVFFCLRLEHSWTVKVRTGRFPNCQAKCPLSIALCGRQQTSTTVPLTEVNGFGPGQTYIFKTDLEEIDQVFKIRIGFEDYAAAPTLFIEEIYCELVHGPQYSFAIGEWIWAGPRYDTWREFLVKKSKLQLKVCKYQLAIWTGVSPALGQVFVELVGSRGDTGKRKLASSKNHCKKFQPNQVS